MVPCNYGLVRDRIFHLFQNAQFQRHSNKILTNNLGFHGCYHSLWSKLTISKRKFSKTVPLVVQTLFSLLLLFIIQNRISSSDADLIINL